MLNKHIHYFLQQSEEMVAKEVLTIILLLLQLMVAYQYPLDIKASK